MARRVHLALAAAAAAAAAARAPPPARALQGGDACTAFPGTITGPANGTLTLGTSDLNGEYLSPATCLWSIDGGSPNATVSLTLNWVRLGRSSECMPSWATLNVLSGTGSGGSVLGSLCWYDPAATPGGPPLVLTAQGVLSLRLVVVMLNTAHGFSANYSISGGGGGDVSPTPTPSATPLPGGGNATATESATPSASPTASGTVSATPGGGDSSTSTPTQSATPSPSRLGVGPMVLSMDPYPSVTFDVPYTRPTGRPFSTYASLRLWNHPPYPFAPPAATAPVTVTAANVTCIDCPYPASTGSNGGTRPPLAVETALPLVMQPGGSGVLTLALDWTYFPPGASAPSFMLVTVDVAAPPGVAVTGPRAVAVEVRISGVPPPVPPPPPGAATGAAWDAGFKVGVGAAYGALAGAVLLCVVGYWRCCRKRRGGGGRFAATSNDGFGSGGGSGSAGAPPPPPPGAGRRGGGGVSMWDLLFGDVNKLRAANAAAAARRSGGAGGAGGRPGAGGASAVPGSSSSGGAGGGSVESDGEEGDATGYAYGGAPGRRRGGDDEERQALSAKKPSGPPSMA
jgi:hypothetical protein